MNDKIALLITWTTYGTWLPGDQRGWRGRNNGPQPPNSRLKQWCRHKMTGDTVLLREHDRKAVEDACREHCEHRGWYLLAVSARTNHVHVVVIADRHPQTVRDQLKANCTRRLRNQHRPLLAKRTWTRGGDCAALNKTSEIEAAMRYVLEAQDQKWREQPSPP